MVSRCARFSVICAADLYGDCRGAFNSFSENWIENMWSPRRSAARCGCFCVPITAIDPRSEFPISLNLMPMPYAMQNPGGHSGRMAIFVSACTFAVLGAISVRWCLGSAINIHRHNTAVILSSLAFAFFLAIHLWAMPSRYRESYSDWSNVWAIIGLYILMLAHAAYFLGLFYDFNATSKPIEIPKAGEPSQLRDLN